MTCKSAPLLLLAFLSAGGGAPQDSAYAQATQPAVKVVEERATGAAAARPTLAAARNSWPGAVQHFFTSMAAGEVDAAWAMMGSHARIDEFDPDAPATFARLVDLAKGASLLGIHAYESAPTTLADDIAGNVRDVAAIPEDFRRRMTPRDEDEAARANATAAQWMVQNLSAEKGQPLAAIVLWDAAEAQVKFILLKGVKTPASTPTFHITHVVFGNPLIVPR
jgi:hypothetical protein